MGFQGQPSYQACCQTAHFAVACAMAQLAITLSLPGFVGLLWTLGFAILKEWVYDLRIEGDTIAGSALDFAFYLVGLSVSVFVFWLTGRLT
jgi:hypothetical protein